MSKWLLILMLLAAPVVSAQTTYILGDSIAKDDTCSDVVAGPPEYLAPANNLAVDGNVIYRVTGLVRHLPAGPTRAWVHVGINDVMLDNRQIYKDMAQLLDTISRQKNIYFVIDTLGQMAPSYYSPAREAVRQQVNAQLLAFHATNVTIHVYDVDIATETCDGIHPNNIGYARNMPVVLTDFAVSGR